MIYSYTRSNLLEYPNTYMYTPFQGIALFQSYMSGRVAVIQRYHKIINRGEKSDHMLVTNAIPVLGALISDASPHAGAMFRAFLETAFPEKSEDNKDSENIIMHELATYLRQISIDSKVNTLNLLHALIAAQLTREPDRSLKVWIDRIVQRFEVSKKIYEVYHTGFRKGDELNNCVRLYWLFALVLGLYYTKAKGLKYLNTLLKICDLLCSLPEVMVCEELPANGLILVLATEVASIFLLAERKGISIVSE